MKIHTRYLKLPGKNFVTQVFLIIVSIFVLQSCHDNDADPINSYDYFPVKVGQFSIFEVNQVVYAMGQKDSVSTKWQEKDEVTKLLKSEHGVQTFILSRFTRNSSSGTWQKVKEFSIQKFPDKIIETLDNEINVPMLFPIDSNLQWNGYMYINLDEKDYRYGYKNNYQNINKPLAVGAISFDNTLMVKERFDTSMTYYKVAQKYYALDVGLICAEQADFEYLQDNGDLIGYKVIASGQRKTRKIIAYGQNN